MTEPHPKLGIEESPFYLNTETRPWLTRDSAPPRRAAVSSFGFGGSNFHTVLEEYPQRAAAPAWDGSVEIIALSAPDRGQLANALAAWKQAATDGLDEAHLAVRAAASRQAFSPVHDCRLLLVVEKGDDLLRLIDAARAELERSSATSWHLPGVHFGSGAKAGAVALLFPGQASQYVGMGRDLACVFPEAQAALVAADVAAGAELALVDKIFPQPTFNAERRQANEAALTQTQAAQPALGAVSLACLRVFERFELRADFAAGHSFGELVALHAAGRIDEVTLLSLAAQRGRVMGATTGEAGTMAAVRAPLDELAALIADRGIDVVLANRNTPDQGVLSGTKAAIQAALEACTTRGWRATPLNVSGAFHSPLMAQARTQFAAALKKATFAPGRIPVFANTTGAPHGTDAAAVREALAAQLVEPVRFVEMIEALYAAGARSFVEVGPKGVLTGLVGTILRGRPHEAMALDAGAGRRSGLFDLADVLARLAAAGHVISLNRWESSREIPKAAKMSVPLRGSNYRTPRSAEQASRGPAVRPQRAAAVVSEEKHAVNDSVHPSNMPGAPAAPAGRAAPPSPTPSLDGTVVAGMFQIVQEGMRAMQVLQQQTAAAHQRFLEGQDLTQRVFQQVMESQQRLFERVAGLPVTPGTALPPMSAPTPMPVATWTQPLPPPTPAYVPQQQAYTPPAPVPTGAASSGLCSAPPPVAVRDPGPGGRRDSRPLRLLHPSPRPPAWKTPFSTWSPNSPATRGKWSNPTWTWRRIWASTRSSGSRSCRRSPTRCRTCVRWTWATWGRCAPSARSSST